MILERVVQPVWVIDEAGLIRFASASAATVLGYGHACDLLGLPSHQAVHHEEFHAEGDLVRRDGSLLPVEFWSAPIDLPGGRGAVVSFTDISERRRTQRAILEAAHDGVLSIDQHARIVYANTAAERIFGYRADELIGQEMAETIVPPSLREAHRAGFSRYMATGESHILDRRIEMTALRADGSEFPVELTITRAGLPGSPAFIGYIRDLTERERAAQELIVSRARLVTASYAARQQVTRDLHDGAQQRFVSAIIGLQIAQRKWVSEPHRARELVDLALSDAMHGMDELRELAAGIHPAILTQRGLAPALAGLAGRLPVPVQLDLPRDRLPGPIEATVYFFCAEALTNVVKHARASSARVNVTVDGERCVVEVRDDGIGGAQARSDSSGLTGLRDRIDALNGVMNILAPAEGGTVLHAAIPLPRHPAGPTP